MLRLQNLTKQFWSRGKILTAVDDLSLDVKPGVVFGFIGLNGAGKTTTIKMILELIFPDQGRATWKGQDTRAPSVKHQIGFMPEQPQFQRHLTADEVLQYVGELFELDEAEIKKRAASLLRKVGLTGQEKTPVRNFSKGMNQRLALAIALVNDPALLVLDEPLDGLDPIGRAQFKELIRAQKQAGKTVFLSSHILSDIDELCDEIAVIDRGKLLFTGSPKKLTGQKTTLENAFVKLVGKR